MVAGGYQSCGVTSGGAAWCWGEGAGLVPTQMAPSIQWRTIVPWGGGRCGLSTTGAAYCDVTPTGGTIVPGGYTWTQLSSSGRNHICGVTSTGDAYCFGGDNPWGEHGNGTTTPSATPVKVSGGLRWASVSVGGYNIKQFTCGVTQQGVAYCWGATDYGSLGISSGLTQQSLVPAEVWLKAP